MKRLAIIAAIMLSMVPATALAVEEEIPLPCFMQGTEQVEQAEPQEAISGEEFKVQGVVDYNGRTETYYSSNVLYHYRTGEWTPDEEGFYRDENGYYVVAASNYEQGTVIETSRGDAIVLDSGCDDGVTDFYVNWA